MNIIFIALLLTFSLSAAAEKKSYHLDPAFLDARTVEFTRTSNNGETISAILKNQNGKKFRLPDTCEPEGGSAELKDAFVINARHTYFLFICAWSVNHSGLGINGTQYEAFLYSGDRLSALKKNIEFSQALSGYEGSLEDGGKAYTWYLSREIASQKISELESGKKTDTLNLAHKVILAQLNDENHESIKAYMDSNRFENLIKDYPIHRLSVVAYNDIGYALGQAGANDLAYKVLKSVASASPARIVLKLNIADVLWNSDKETSKTYYKKYVESMRQIGKENSIPQIVLDRIKSR